MGEALKGKMGRRGQRDEVLSAYLDGELSPREREHLEAQLAADPALQAELEALRRTVALVRDLPPIPVPRNFILPQTIVTPPRPPQPSRPRWAWAAPLLTAATAIVSLACGVVLAADLLLSGLGGMATAPAAEQMLEVEAPEAAVAPSPAVEMAVEAEREMPEATAPAEAPRAAEEAETDAEESYAPEGMLEEEVTVAGEDRAPDERPAAAPPAPEKEEPQPVEPAAGGGAEEPAAPAPTAAPSIEIEKTVVATPTASEVVPAPMATETPARAVEATPPTNITEEGPHAPARGVRASSAITRRRVLEATLALTSLVLAVATVWAWRIRRR